MYADLVLHELANVCSAAGAGGFDPTEDAEEPRVPLWVNANQSAIDEDFLEGSYGAVDVVSLVEEA